MMQPKSTKFGIIALFQPLSCFFSLIKLYVDASHNAASLFLLQYIEKKKGRGGGGAFRGKAITVLQ